MKIVCFSDTHGLHDEFNLPEADLMIHAGDWSDLGLLSEITSFESWLKRLPYENKIVIAGNHDICCEARPELIHMKHMPMQKIPWDGPRLYQIKNAEFLHMSGTEINGLKIWGEPRTPAFYNWAFNWARSEMNEVWEMVPQDIDVLVTHGPPYMVGDKVVRRVKGQEVVEYVGCESQLDMILNHPTLKLVVCGHIHDGRGEYHLEKSNGDTVKIVNASCIRDDYRVANQEPIVVEI